MTFAAYRHPLTILVMVKEPVPGRVKTRLTPPLPREEAAQWAEACIRDTLQATRAAGLQRRVRTVVMLDGAPGPWLPPDIEVIAQAGEGLARRLSHAFSCVDGPALVIGMDTPQITPDLLWPNYGQDGADGVMGPAVDGGFWALGMIEPDPTVFDSVPMSSDDTGAHQWAALTRRCPGARLLPSLRDMDTIEDAHAIAQEHPELAIARAVHEYAALPR